MKTFVATLILGLVWFGASLSYAEIKTYESTENAGQNKKERIDTVESYLINLSSSLQKMETKLDENAKKILVLDQAMKSVQDKMNKREAEEKLAAAKKPAAKNGDEKGEGTAADKSDEKSAEKSGEAKMDAKVGERTEKSEIDRLKADMMALKNQDMEKLKASLEELSETVKAIQATLRK